ncbi:hypothetical protein TNCV_4962081 [Trichonephila clavipes]|nr:hypothetical protein TNCV_4962081 [Trichonephila clavipes]
MPHSLYDCSKDPTYEGFYDSVFEKPDMWSRGLEFSEASGLEKDVHGILQRYTCLKTWSGFTLWGNTTLFPYFVGRWKRFGTNLSFYPSGVYVMDWKVKYNTGT